MAVAPAHRFKVGQTVVIVPGSAGRAMPLGKYVVVRLRSVADGKPHYRAKSITEGTVWALVEDQMQPVAAELADKTEPGDGAV